MTGTDVTVATPSSLTPVTKTFHSNYRSGEEGRKKKLQSCPSITHVKSLHPKKIIMKKKKKQQRSNTDARQGKGVQFEVGTEVMKRRHPVAVVRILCSG